MISVNKASIKLIEHIKLLRFIARLLPVGHRLYPLVRGYSSYEGLLGIEFGRYYLLYPATWLAPLRSHIIFTGQKNYPEFRLFKSLIQKINQGTIVDVGANFGEWVLMTRECTSLPVVAYEPSPVSAQVMQQMVDYNQLDNVQVRNAACGNANEEIVLDTSIVSYIHHGDLNKSSTGVLETSQLQLDSAGEVKKKIVPVTVPMVRLDDELSQSRVSLLKIDCEGFEYEVLSGAIKILEEQRPMIYLEVHPGQIEAYGHSPKDVIDFLRPYYDMRFFVDNREIGTEQDVWDAVAKATPPGHIAGYPIHFQIAVICTPRQ